MFVFSSFKKKVKIAPKDIYIDNMVFRLHYRITVWFLLACSLLVGSREFIKNHINCISDKGLTDVINTYCFFSTTFTIVKYHNTSYENGLAAHPGVGPYVLNKDNIIRHAYYQWVPFVLFGQALLFYLPHLIWKSIENGRMITIVKYMKISPFIAADKCVIKDCTIESEDTRNKKVLWLKDAYLSLTRFKINRDWSTYLVVCELLNAGNLIGQLFLMNKFLQGNFFDLGIKWWNHSDDALDLVFPKVTKCIFYKYGASGTVQIHDTICVMPLNIINEKIYCLLWFWFLILFILTTLALLWRILTFILHSRSYNFNKWIWGELSPGPALRSDDILVITSKLCFNDWLFLYYIGKNINGNLFRETVAHLSQSLKKQTDSELLEQKKPSQEHYVLLQSTPTQSRGVNESYC